MSAERDTPREICLIRLSSIGDVCNAVPAVLAIQDRYPDARLTWIIGRAEHGLHLIESQSAPRRIDFPLFSADRSLRS